MVTLFVEEHQLDMPLEARLLDVVCELGELAKVVLTGTNYGVRSFAGSESLKEECGDVLFSLMCVAAITGTDLEAALHGALSKYSARIRERGTPSSG